MAVSDGQGMLGGAVDDGAGEEAWLVARAFHDWRSVDRDSAVALSQWRFRRGAVAVVTMPDEK